ncbi:DsbA family protein [Trueperella sp. LYQ143]|uniref:DsbA family protein n=1 Tax=unclassified Trueperella TaxID=2630174 RepID=UPI00398371DA
MSELPTMQSPASSSVNSSRRNKRIIGSVILALLMVVLVVIAILVNRHGGKSDPQAGSDSPSTTASHSTDAPKESDNTASGEPSEDPSSKSASNYDNPEIRALIEKQWRRAAGDPMAIGPVDAPLVIEIYYDFQCVHCAESAVEHKDQLQQLADSGKARIEYNNLPILGDASVLAAQGAEAAAKQGKFFEYFNYIFSARAAQKPADLSQEGIIKIAQEIGVPDINAFTADMTSPETVAKVNERKTYLTGTLGITGTPAFLIGYSFVPGNVPSDTLNEIIQEELARPHQ